VKKADKRTEEVYEFVRRVARHQGWELNRDDSFLQDLVEGLRVNYSRYGYFLCPCRDGSGQRDKDRDIVCPCVYNIPDQQQYGHCFCGLFLSKAFHAKNREPAPIPERRPPELYS
jgi:ferredoxin-thioredoxin reductase catalytic chain